MTTLSLDMRAGMTAESSDIVAITLLTFTLPSGGDLVRLSSDRTRRFSIDPVLYGTMSRGDRYLWMPMSLVLPDDADGTPPEARLVLGAADREIFKVIRASREKASCKIEIVSEAAPDTVQEQLGRFKVQTAPYDEGQVSIVLGQKSFLGEGWPYCRFTPGYAPGLHR